MSHAKFIKTDKQYLCNICSDEIENDKIISLKCDPKKHIFCYDCIFDWYKELNKKNNHSNYPVSNICPICREKGGLLPVYGDDKPIKNINIMNTKKLNTELIINENKYAHECGVKLKSKNGFCHAFGKKIYGGFCGLHKTVVNDVAINLVHQCINPNKLTHQCGVKFKSKLGYCEASGKECYGGFCGVHKGSLIVPANNDVLVV